MSNSKIDNVGGITLVNAPLNTTEIKEEIEDTSKDVSKSIVEETQEQTKSTMNKHIITYIGNSRFVDSVGYKWYKDIENTYSDDEYKDRTDLHFMVKYGEMKHTLVTV